MRRRYGTEKLAREALAEIAQQASIDAFVPRKAVTVEELCKDWLASLHNAGATTINATGSASRRFGSVTVRLRPRNSPGPT